MLPTPLSPRFLAALSSVALCSPAFSALSIDFVSVGNPGNTADTNGRGSVPFEYLIGKYEVTNADIRPF